MYRSREKHQMIHQLELSMSTTAVSIQSDQVWSEATRVNVKGTSSVTCVVTIFPKENCSCPSTSSCYQILAVKLGTANSIAMRILTVHPMYPTALINLTTYPVIITNLTVHPMYPTALINLMTYPVKIANLTVHPIYPKAVINPTRYLVSFPGSSAWAEKNKSGTHCLRMLSFPRISGNLEISVKSAPLH